MADFFRGRKWDLVGLRKLWFAISLLVIIPGMIAWVTRGLNYGIDFTGGGLITYQLAQPVSGGRETETLGRARAAVGESGIDARLQLAGTAGRTDQLLVRTRVEPEPGQDPDDLLTQQQTAILQALQGAFPGVTWVAGEMVSPVVSEELIRNAIYSVLAGCIFVLLWIRLRYMSFQWSASAVVALVHDVLVLLGVFAITQKEVNSPFVAAALTVVGYSVHDSIVLFDRIRENLRLRKGASFADTANTSLIETMPRSINTVLTTELVLIALYVLGGASLRDFTFAMIVGITAGAYSSIFTAAQLLTIMRERDERKVAARRAAGRPIREAPGRAPTAARPRAVAATAPVRTPSPQPRAETAEGDSQGDTGDSAEAGAAGAAEHADRGERKKLRAGRKRKRRF